MCKSSVSMLQNSSRKFSLKTRRKYALPSIFRIQTVTYEAVYFRKRWAVLLSVLACSHVFIFLFGAGTLDLSRRSYVVSCSLTIESTFEFILKLNNTSSYFLTPVKYTVNENLYVHLFFASYIFCSN